MSPSLVRASLGIAMIAFGIVVELIATDVLTIDERLVHAPPWIIALLGLVFLGGGLAIVVDPKGAIAAWAAGTVVVTITIVSGWIALYGSSEAFSGNWPFLSRETNVTIARVVFGCVALLGLAITLAAAKTWRGGDRVSRD